MSNSRNAVHFGAQKKKTEKNAMKNVYEKASNIE